MTGDAINKREMTVDGIGKRQITHPHVPFNLSVPAFASIVAVGSLLVATAVCVFLWKCFCFDRYETYLKRKRKQSAIQGIKQSDTLSFVLPTVIPATYEEQVQLSTNKSTCMSKRPSLAYISDINDNNSDIGSENFDMSRRASYLGQRRASVISLAGSSGMLSRRGSMSAFEINPEDLDRDIYPSGDESVPSMFGLGRMCFSMIFANDTLSVTLVRAVYLCSRSAKETADPYCKLVLLPDRKPKYVSRIHRNTLNPVFVETFRFPASPDTLNEKTLRITVCDYDRFSRQVVLGYVTFPLRDVSNDRFTDGTDDIWRDIHVRDDQVRRSSGRLLLSLCYDEDKGALSVSVLKANNLTSTEADKETVGCFVKVSMLVAERLIKTKRTKTHRIRAQTLWNEEFVIHIAPALINQVSLSVSVCLRSVFGVSRVLGKTNAGPFMYATGQGLDHWTDMMASQKSAVAYWHDLR